MHIIYLSVLLSFMIIFCGSGSGEISAEKKFG